MADLWVALIPVVRNGCDTGTDEPANADIIDTSTGFHALVMRTTGHNMPNSAVKETYTGKGHEENLCRFEACRIPNGRKEGYRIQDKGYKVGMNVY